MAGSSFIPATPSQVVIGIDLGTTNSLMAIVDAADTTRYLPPTSKDALGESSYSTHIPVRLLQLPQQNLDGTVAEHFLFPSVVFQSSPDGPRFFGMGAREARYQHDQGRTVFYSVKKELGKGRDPFYPRAVTPDLNTPVKVSAAILEAMRKAAEIKLGYSLSRVPVVITVPASFQSPQRRDTLLAAQIAGFDVSEGCLFDEPNAALLGYMNRRRVQTRWDSEETVLVFDFGGGTCDISIIDVTFAPVSQQVTLRNLALSRFEELGGDDIDHHLVHTHLAHLFYQATGRAERQWPLKERRRRIWSQLAKLAESLKVRMCQELDKVAQATQWNEAEMRKVRVSLPAQPVQTSQGEVWLPNLSLDYDTFALVMRPFLQPDGLEDADKEYYRLTSILTPIRDALKKANLQPNDITRVLMVGGSSYNPLVEQTISRYFAEATVDRPPNMDFLVAEGAAVHSYFQHIQGVDILKPIVGDTIGLLAEGKVFVPLIHAGSPIPFPDDRNWVTHTQFRVPKDLMPRVDFVLCAGNASRPVHTVTLAFDTIIPRNTSIHLKLRLDNHKVLHLQALLPDYPAVQVSERIDNPLALLPMTPLQRRRAELEQTLAQAQEQGTLDHHIEEMVELASTLNRMKRSELAQEWIEQAIQRSEGDADRDLHATKAWILNSLGENNQAHHLWAEIADRDPSDHIAAFNAGQSAPDLATREKYLRQAVAAAPGDGIARVGLYQALWDKGDHLAAKDTLFTARRLLEGQVQSTPNSHLYLYYLAYTYEQLGERYKAEEIRRRIEQLGKDDLAIETDYLVGLANALARR